MSSRDICRFRTESLKRQLGSQQSTESGGSSTTQTKAAESGGSSTTPTDIKGAVQPTTSFSDEKNNNGIVNQQDECHVNNIYMADGSHTEAGKPITAPIPLSSSNKVAANRYTLEDPETCPTFPGLDQVGLKGKSDHGKPSRCATACC